MALPTSESPRAQILIVEDEPDHADVMSEALRKPGHVSTIVTDVPAAMEELRGGSFDIIITDLRMPSSAGASTLNGEAVAPDGSDAGLAVLRAAQEYGKARGLHGRTLGLLGFGSIARELARRAQALGLHLVIWSRRFAAGQPLDAEAAGLEAGGRAARVALASSPADVAAQADILSVHLALTPETRGIVDATVLDRLAPGAIFVNTARAEIVDYTALERAVAERGLRAGLDVFPGEPTASQGAFTTSLAGFPTVYGTHHIGASTEQAQEAIAAETVRIVESFQQTGRAPNVVNLAARTPATHRLVVRHRDRPGVLAHVFDCLREGSLNVQETENVVFAGAEAAVARINVDGAPGAALLERIRAGNENVIDVQVIRL